MDPQPWHALGEEDVLRWLGAAREGLPPSEIESRRARHGPNRLEAEQQVSPLRLVLEQFRSPLVYLLLIAAAIALLLQHYVDFGAITAVLLLNAGLGVVQAWRAEQALGALQQMAAPHAHVRRGGQTSEIPAEAVVPGDIVLLERGQRVPADARVLTSEELHVDESALTGESEPVTKAPGTFPDGQPLADRKNMVWMSTAVTGGHAEAVVVGTGMETAIGRIADQVRETERAVTPLQRRVGRLATLLGIVGVLISGAVFGLGLLKGFELGEMALYAIAVAVSAIPEGLPAIISITLALGVQRMARQHAIVRRLPAVETLGSTTVICTDKTGTLTQNEMTVTRVWADGQTFEVTGNGYRPEGELRPLGGDGARPASGPLPPAVRKLMLVGSLASNAQVVGQGGEWTVEGNPTEGGILTAARKLGLDPPALREQHPRRAELPFASEQQYMAVLHPDPDNGRARVFVKGAPDRVLSFCTHVLVGDAAVAIDEQRRGALRAVHEQLAADALRVIAGAYRDAPAGDALAPETAEHGLTLVGFWGLLDPPRPEARESVAAAQGAGIRVAMLTGDHAATASSIARQLGIGAEQPAMSGSEVDEADEAALAEHALQAGVFARVAPAHKLKILRALQERRQVVAMTGDGVNDAPALKGADIGVAMGRGGTEVAREAADMILTDDNFATIVRAVEEGRVIFTNIRRAIAFLVTTNLGELITFTAALALDLPLPATAVMILWINLVTDGICTLPLAVEPRHRDVLKQPPRPPDAGILDRPVLVRVFLLAPVMAAGTLGLFWYEMRSGAAHAYAQSVAFTVLSAFQWFHALNSRSTSSSLLSVGVFTNRWMLVGIGAAVVLQVLAVQTGLGNALFGTRPLGGGDWLLIVGSASTIFILDEVFKRVGLYRRFERRRAAASAHTQA